MNLPGMFGDRIYNRYDKEAKGFITSKDFIYSSISFFSFNLDDKLKLVFDLFDFDNDGKVDASDIWTLMSQVPLQNVK
jgi:Ca2+-binding EF-hand superfamily protein